MLDALCGRSSVVERHVANVNVMSSNLIARLHGHQWTGVDTSAPGGPIVTPPQEIRPPRQTRPFALSCPQADTSALWWPAVRHRVGHQRSPSWSLRPRLMCILDAVAACVWIWIGSIARRLCWGMFIGLFFDWRRDGLCGKRRGHLPGLSEAPPVVAETTAPRLGFGGLSLLRGLPQAVLR